MITPHTPPLVTLLTPHSYDIRALNVVVLTPAVFALDLIGLESLQEQTWISLGMTCIKGMFDNVLSDVLWAWAIMLTSPTVATVGLSLTVPAAVLSDIVRGLGIVQSLSHSDYASTFLTLLGATCVIAAFFAIGIPDGGCSYRSLRIPNAVLVRMRGCFTETVDTSVKL